MRVRAIEQDIRYYSTSRRMWYISNFYRDGQRVPQSEIDAKISRLVGKYAKWRDVRPADVFVKTEDADYGRCVGALLSLRGESNEVFNDYHKYPRVAEVYP